MEQKLFSELRPLFTSSKERPNEIRIRIRMRDLIAPEVLRHAVDTTMSRYPYFCVELQKKDGQYIFAENHRPVVITNSLHGVDLNDFGIHSPRLAATCPRPWKETIIEKKQGRGADSGCRKVSMYIERTM